MVNLHTLYLRWCGQIRDFGLSHLCGMRGLQVLSLAGKSLRLCVTDNNQMIVLRSFPRDLLQSTIFPLRMSTVFVECNVKLNPAEKLGRVGANQLPGRHLRVDRVPEAEPPEHASVRLERIRV